MHSRPRRTPVLVSSALKLRASNPAVPIVTCPCAEASPAASYVPAMGLGSASISESTARRIAAGRIRRIGVLEMR